MRINSFPSSRLKKQLYFSLVYSHFNYCALIWETGIKTDNDRLSALQRRAIRTLYNENVHPVTVMRTQNIRPFHEIYNQKLSAYIFSEVSSNYSQFVSHYLNRDTGHNLRRTFIVTEKPRTNYAKQTIDHQIMKLCNIYPDILEIAKTCRCLRTFKRRIQLLFTSNSRPNTYD